MPVCATRTTTAKFKMKHIGRFLTYILLCAATFHGCMEWDYDLDTDFDVTPVPGQGLFIANEGNFQYGNASLSFYDIASGTVENDVFIRANGQKLGDVAQSMTMHDGTLWIVVNNSHVIFAVDPVTFKEKGRITGFTSPRYIHFISDEKAYVTQLWDNRIFIVNPKRYEITGYIDTGMSNETGSTEEMIGFGDYIITNCWSYQDKILKIDTKTDKVTGELRIGIQPTAMAADADGKLWVLTDGGYEGSPAGYEKPTLSRIDPETFTIEKTFTFYGDGRPYAIETNLAKDSLYFINDGVWKMSVKDESLPQKPFIESRDTKYYAFGVCPFNSDIYVADAIDWQQKGIVYRYSPSGKLIDEFRTGISPGAFCWY